jgi:signal transduction histidine kinase
VYIREATDWSHQRSGTSISIIDTGVGIKPEDAKRLFQPFFSTKSTKGTGLGLWISKGIVQKYDGTLRCRSYRTGKGCVTCFRVFLPVSGPNNPTSGTSGEAAKLEPEMAPSNHRAATW